MHVIYVDADACPVKDEVYRVARRFGLRVTLVANSALWIPKDDQFELIVERGFGAADDRIASEAGPGDIVVTADIPLAARCVTAGAIVLDHKGRILDENSVGEALAVRNLMDELRQAGNNTSGPSALAPKDRSRFLSQLDLLVHSVRRRHPPRI